MPHLPGLLALTPPRRTARGREQDRLIVYLALTGNMPFSTADYMQAGSQVAAQFYQTPGSLTNALRTAAQALNDMLLERNLRTTGRGQFAIGWLALGALRGTQLFLLLSGPMHAFTSTAGETRHIHDPALSGRGLGLSQALTAYFAQVDLLPGERLLLCSQAPQAWLSALSTEREGGSLEAVSRRLMALAGAEVNAALIQAEAGSGQLTVVKGRRAPDAETLEPDHSAAGGTVPAAPPAWHSPAEAESAPAEQMASPSAYAIPLQREQPINVDGLADLPRDLDERPNPIRLGHEYSPDEFETLTPRLPGQQTRRAARTAVTVFDIWRRASSAVSRGFQKLLPLLLPGSDPHEPVRLPGWWMAFVAVAVPLVVVTIASLVFFSFGRPIEDQELYSQARAEAARAVGEGDPVRQREAWENTLTLLNLLESHKITPESQALRQQAQTGLDGLLSVFRLDFQPIISGSLGNNIRITRMAATDTDLYMLDGETGSVLRIFLTGSGYQRDLNFKCQKGQYGNDKVDTLVDIFTLPRGNSANASVIGIDAAGTLLYCAPNQDPQSVSLPPPDTNWASVRAATLDGSLLYVLDASANAVWIYTGQNGVFKERPSFYFEDQVPSLAGAIDLAVNGDDLYILHADGHLSTCSYSRLDAVPTRCEEFALLQDPRSASTDRSAFQKKKYKQILISAPPDAALLLLDDSTPVTYRFSPRLLELQNQIQPLANVTGQPVSPASAMTMNANHVLFLALDNRIYFANNVP
jgi:hypothetical protein